MSNTPLVLDRRPELTGPGTHVLLCAVDEYPHLDGVGPQGPYGWFDGLSRLNAPVRTARAILTWLTDGYENPHAPLATCRALLSPVFGTPDSHAPAGAVAATGGNLLRAAAEWRRDACSHRDSVALFYFAGHGFSLGPSEDVLMMEDFRDGIGSDFRNAMDVNSLLNGMAPTERYRNIARTQLFFIDAGRQRLPLSSEILSARPTAVFDVGASVQDDRAALVFQASADNSVPFARPHGLTLFGEALLTSLRGKAAVDRNGEWVVTTLSLMEGLRDELTRLAAEGGVTQSLSIRGQTKDALVTVCGEAPPSKLVVAGFTSKDLRARLSDSSFVQVHEWSAPFTGPVEAELKPGTYVLEVDSPTGSPRRSILALAPGKTFKIDL